MLLLPVDGISAVVLWTDHQVVMQTDVSISALIAAGHVLRCEAAMPQGDLEEYHVGLQ